MDTGVPGKDASEHYPVPVVWDVPSRSSSGSMPLGNGDIGLNVWAEEDGDLLFYIGKTDSWDENGRLLKLGRIRISLLPNPFSKGLPFRQILHTAEGYIEIVAGRDREEVNLRLWVDANQPVVRVEIHSPCSFSVRASLELWRNEKRDMEKAESHCPIGLRSPDEYEHVHPDNLLPVDEKTAAWYHRNIGSCWESTLKHQDLASWVSKGKDPLYNLTFGGLMCSREMVKDRGSTLVTEKPQRRAVLSVHILTAQTSTINEWSTALQRQSVESDAVPLESSFAMHVDWWHRFWERSWINVSGTQEAGVVSRGYQLQRFINACGGRGRFPIKFNGSIFTVDAREPNENYDADYRRWGGGYWFQNTRLAYWPMINSGDFDLMEPLFRMYIEALPLALERSRLCFGIEGGAMFPETMTFWGTYLNSNYGYSRGGLQQGLSENTYIRFYWQGMLELLAILLDAYAVSGDRGLLHEKLLVLAPPFLRFYRGYYKLRDDDGRMLLKPSQALETWQKSVNPAPDIAGLQRVLDGLLRLPETEVPSGLRNEWIEMRQIIPVLPTRSYLSYKRRVVIPALQYDDYRNSENPEMYAVFPYRIYGVGKPDIETGLDTWNARYVKDTGGWRQDAIQAAMLGLSDEARVAVVKNFSSTHPGSRFPAFWGPNFDWIPDQDNGGVACIALQRMLIHYDNGRILLFPAWPQDWDVDFKLYAPGRTTVECSFRNGRIEFLRVSPESRLGDVVVMNKK